MLSAGNAKQKLSRQSKRRAPTLSINKATPAAVNAASASSGLAINASPAQLPLSNNKRARRHCT